MAYQTYTTKALVCGTKNRNTADRSYLLFTREAGMLFADARSVREERSRQRYALQDFSLVRVSLVKGKYGWKIGSIQSQKNYYHEANDKVARGSVVSVYRLLRRFVHGEVVDQNLFDYVMAALDEVVHQVSERAFLELVVQVHILGFLGYVDVKKIPEPLYELAPSEISKYCTDVAVKQVEQIYAQAVAISHL